MKYFLNLLLFTFFLNTVVAQEKHFVFIESDTRQLFNVSLNGKIYSSSAAGYVIIPKLADGEYTAVIGFASITVPEQTFKYTIAQKDLGFSLKNFGGKGWGLFDLQTLAITMAGETKFTTVASNVEKPKEEYRPEISFERKKDTVTAKVETKIEEPVASANNNTSSPDSVPFVFPVTNISPVATDTQPQVNSITPEAKTPEQKADVSTNILVAQERSQVKKVAEFEGNMGIYLTYVDITDKAVDTVQIIIPVDNKEASSKEIISADKPASDSDISGSKLKTDDLRFLNIKVNTPVDSANQTDATISAVPVITNSNCVNVASESDYNKLRRKMGLQSTEEAKMNEARKIFKNKCFTTSQLKGLSSLFLSDESRYKFFDASYNFVTDLQQYSSLETELIDPYYITRFKAMLKH